MVRLIIPWHDLFLSHVGLAQTVLRKGNAALHHTDVRAVAGAGCISMSYPLPSATSPLQRSAAIPSSGCTYWYGLWILHRICHKTSWRQDPSSHVWWMATSAGHYCGKRHPSFLWLPPWLLGMTGRWLCEGHKVQPQLSDTAKQPSTQ